MNNIIDFDNISVEKIEQLRTILIEDYIANSPISIRNFIKLIRHDPALPAWNILQKYFKTSSFQKIFMDGSLNINLRKSKKYDNKTIENKKCDILKRIVEIYTTNNNVVTEKLLKENNLYPTHIKHYFTSIGEAYKLAGVKATYTKAPSLTKEDFVIRFTKLIPEFTENNIRFKVEGVVLAKRGFYTLRHILPKESFTRIF